MGRVGSLSGDRQAFDQLVVFMKLDRLIIPLGDGEDQGAGETGRVAFIDRGPIPQKHDPVLYGHGGNLESAKGLPSPYGGEYEPAIEGIGGQTGRLVPEDEGHAEDLIELLSVMESDEGKGVIGLEFIGDEIARVGLEVELADFPGES
tara:strand:- start:1009 stop:1452 length:444 start_codon:yes stop_codon:yes gene_type:complete